MWQWCPAHRVSCQTIHPISGNYKSDRTDGGEEKLRFNYLTVFTRHSDIQLSCRLREKLTAKQIDWQEHCQCQSVGKMEIAWWPPLFSLQLIIKTSNSKQTLINIANTSNSNHTPHHTTTQYKEIKMDFEKTVISDEMTWKESNHFLLIFLSRVLFPRPDISSG